MLQMLEKQPRHPRNTPSPSDNQGSEGRGEVVNPYHAIGCFILGFGIATVFWSAAYLDLLDKYKRLK